MDDYKLKIDVFEGPMDLLLHLVKINEMDIYDIPIAAVTKQYLEYLKLIETLDLEIAGDFLVMAATLLNIKARALLPERPEGEAEQEEEEVGDILTARALMEQLVEYRKYKEAAGALARDEERQANIFFREVALPKLMPGDDEELRADLDKMLLAFRRVLRFVEARGWHMVTEEEFSVEEKIDVVKLRLEREKRFELDALFQECRSKIEMIVMVLALLELCRMKAIALDQGDPYGPLHICQRGEGAPKPAEPADIAAAENLPDRPTSAIEEPPDDDDPLPSVGEALNFPDSD